VRAAEIRGQAGIGEGLAKGVEIRSADRDVIDIEYDTFIFLGHGELRA